MPQLLKIESSDERPQLIRLLSKLLCGLGKQIRSIGILSGDVIELLSYGVYLMRCVFIAVAFFVSLSIEK